MDVVVFGLLKHIQSNAGPPRILWPSSIWVLIGAETLTLLWFHTYFVPVELSLDGYL